MIDRPTEVLNLALFSYLAVEVFRDAKAGSIPVPFLNGPRKISAGNHVNIGSLTEVSKNINRIPGARLWLPRTETGVKILGPLVLFGLLLLPIAWVFTYRYVREFIGPTLLPLTILGYALYRMWLSGMGLCRLSKECADTGLKVETWLRNTKQILFSNFSRKAKGIADVGLYGLIAISYALPLACLLALNAVNFAVAGMLALFPLYVGCLLWLYLVVRVAALIRKLAIKVISTRASTSNVNSPIVYLRAFRADRDLASFNPLRTLTVEEEIVSALRCTGNAVVALGKPEETLPPVGADRYYVSDDDWQNTISTWFKKSHAIALIAATTEATAWEIEEVFQTETHERFLILFANADSLLKEQNHFAPRLATAYKHLGKVELASTKFSTFERLQKLGIDCDDRWNKVCNESPSALLLGIAFDAQKQPIFITSENYDYESIEEAIKWHLARVNHEVKLPLPLAANSAEQESFQPVARLRCLRIIVIVSGLLLGLLVLIPQFTTLSSYVSQQTTLTTYEKKTVCGGQVSVELPSEWTIREDKAEMATCSDLLGATAFISVVPRSFLDSEGKAESSPNDYKKDIALAEKTALDYLKNNGKTYKVDSKTESNAKGRVWQIDEVLVNPGRDNLTVKYCFLAEQAGIYSLSAVMVKPKDLEKLLASVRMRDVRSSGEEIARVVEQFKTGELPVKAVCAGRAQVALPADWNTVEDSLTITNLRAIPDFDLLLMTEDTGSQDNLKVSKESVLAMLKHICKGTHALTVAAESEVTVADTKWHQIRYRVEKKNGAMVNGLAQWTSDDKAPRAILLGATNATDSDLNTLTKSLCGTFKMINNSADDQ